MGRGEKSREQCCRLLLLPQTRWRWRGLPAGLLGAIAGDRLGARVGKRLSHHLVRAQSLIVTAAAR
jgi:uncharacterized membrane protein YfcA